MGVVLEWVETGLVFPLPLGRPVEIGRGVQADICVPVFYLNRRHCEAQWDGCRVWVQDLGGRWGTTIEGDRFLGGIRPIRHEAALLRLGDVLQVGRVGLRLATPSRVEDGWLAWQGGLT
jgi:pSer/pThr/pTyr-binding forkhead associated (FHA) protein